MGVGDGFTIDLSSLLELEFGAKSFQNVDALEITGFPLLTTLRTGDSALSAVKDFQLYDLPAFKSIYAGHSSLPKVETLELTGRTRSPLPPKVFPPSPLS